MQKKDRKMQHYPGSHPQQLEETMSETKSVVVIGRSRKGEEGEWRVGEQYVGWSQNVDSE